MFFRMIDAGYEKDFMHWSDDWILTLAERQHARKAAGAKRPGELRYPVKILAGSTQAPKIEGDTCHYETKGGRPIYHPSAYSKRGWSSMVYVNSTVAVYVGSHWKGWAKLQEAQKVLAPGVAFASRRG